MSDKCSRIGDCLDAIEFSACGDGETEAQALERYPCSCLTDLQRQLVWRTTKHLITRMPAVDNVPGGLGYVDGAAGLRWFVCRHSILSGLFGRGPWMAAMKKGRHIPVLCEIWDYRVRVYTEAGIPMGFTGYPSKLKSDDPETYEGPI